MAIAPIPYPTSPSTYARRRPMKSPTLLPIRMNAADTSASSAMALCTPLTVVPRSWTTAEIDTFISDVSTTRTNIAIASRTASLRLNPPAVETSPLGVAAVIRRSPSPCRIAERTQRDHFDTSRRRMHDGHLARQVGCKSSLKCFGLLKFASDDCPYEAKRSPVMGRRADHGDDLAALERELTTQL